MQKSKRPVAYFTFNANLALFRPPVYMHISVTVWQAEGASWLNFPLCVPQFQTPHSSPLIPHSFSGMI